MLAGRPMTLQRPVSGTDAYGNPLAEYAPAGQLQGRIDQQGASEEDTDRETGIVTGTLYTRTAGIRTEDRIHAAGTTWQVAGPPVEKSSATAVHHYEIPVKAVTP